MIDLRHDLQKPLGVLSVVRKQNDLVDRTWKDKEVTSKKEVKGSPNFLKKGSQKLRSLLSLAPEKKDNLSKNKAPAFYRMCSSSDTLISEAEENQKQKNKHQEATRCITF